MTSLSDLAGDAHVVAIVDPDVLRDIATALDGSWSPEGETDDSRRADLVAAARLRLYGVHDRGWVLVTTQQGRDVTDEAPGASWTTGFIPPIEEFDDAPLEPEVDGLYRFYHQQDELAGESARTLSIAMLADTIRYVITRVPSTFRHRRDHDLPARLEVIDAVEAVNRLQLAPGEEPIVAPPASSPLHTVTPWWVP